MWSIVSVSKQQITHNMEGLHTPTMNLYIKGRRNVSKSAMMPLGAMASKLELIDLHASRVEWK